MDSRELSAEIRDKFLRDSVKVGDTVLVQGANSRKKYNNRLRIEIFDMNERNLATDYQSLKKSQSNQAVTAASRVEQPVRRSESREREEQSELESRAPSTFGGISFGLRSETPLSDSATDRTPTPSMVGISRRRD